MDHALAFFNGEEKLTSPALRATLLSSSFDRWRRQHQGAPFSVPPQARAVIPLSVDRITPHTVAAHDEPGYDYVHHLVCHDLKGHSSKDLFKDATKARLKHDRADAKRALHLDSDEPKVQVRIEFDPESDITTVGVCSIVYGVTRREAEELICRAKPMNWAKSPGSFFKSIKAGHLAGEDFVEDDGVLVNESYQIQEEVEWNWGPQLESTGSMINVLEIEDATRDGPLIGDDAVRNHVRRVFQVTDSERESAYVPNAVASAPKIDYSYRLVRCRYSKFLSSWVPGGLDVDDGRYVAIWCPGETADRGAFLTTVQKQIHYSKAAEREAYPQFSQILNLLAPAVITMLLKELAFNSTVTFINDYRLKPTETSCLDRVKTT